MKLFSKILSVLVLLGLGYCIYKFFFNCEKVNVDFKQTFTLSLMDYAEVNHEVSVKLLKVNDNRCKEENCDREGQIEYKLLVVNDMRVNYVKLSTLEIKEVEINKTDYILKLVEGIDENSATFKLEKKEEKKQ